MPVEPPSIALRSTAAVGCAAHLDWAAIVAAGLQTALQGPGKLVGGAGVVDGGTVLLVTGVLVVAGIVEVACMFAKDILRASKCHLHK